MTETLMLPRQCALYAGVELRRLWLTRSGLMTLAATAVIWGLLFRYAIVPAADLVSSRGFVNMISGLFGDAGLTKLSGWPAPELAVYWFFSLLLLPMFSLFFTANQLCTDLERGTLRFLTLRSSRLSLVLGRFSGQMLVQACLISLTLAATVLLAAWQRDGLTLAMLNAAAVIVVNLLIVILPFTALMAVFSALVRSPKLAVSLATVVLGLSFGLLSWFVFYFPDFLFLLGYLPGTQVVHLLTLTGWDALSYAGLPLVQAALFLALATLIMTRRAI